MGLDVYLKKCADLPAAKIVADAYEERSSAAFEALGDWTSLSEEQQKAHWAAMELLKSEMGISGYEAATITEFSENSKADPEHMFKIGYFRSSYNGSGFESVMRKLGLPTLHDIFEPNDEYEVRPDWDAALVRCNDALTRYQAHLESPAGKYSVMEVRPMFEYGVSSEKEALDMFTENVLNREHQPFGGGGWSNRDGEFYPDGMKVCAFITKTFQRSGANDPISMLLNMPAIYAVYERDDDGKENWHLTALRIVRETIEFVIAQPDRQHFYLAWSG